MFKTKTIESIIQGCKKGRIKDQELLYKEFFGYAKGICLRYTYSNDEALDLLNDCFIKVFEKIHMYDVSKPFKLWLRRIIINAAIDEMRRRKTFEKASMDIYHTLSDCTGEGISFMNAEDILKLFNELSEVHRLVFNLYEIEGYTHKEISDMIGIKESSSRSALTRAKDHLKSLYHKYFN